MTTTSTRPAPPPGRLLVLPMPDGRPELVVVVAGEADVATAPRLRDGLAGCLAYRPRSLVVDATDLTFCDLNGLDALIEAVATAERSGVRVTLRPSAQLTWLMTTVHRSPQTSGP